jgi:hypothetical protein
MIASLLREPATEDRAASPPLGIEVAEVAEVAAVPAPASPAQRRTLIAEAAFLIAQSRGFAPDHELDDWLQAEREVDQEPAGAA